MNDEKKRLILQLSELLGPDEMVILCGSERYVDYEQWYRNGTCMIATKSTRPPKHAQKSHTE